MAAEATTSTCWPVGLESEGSKTEAEMARVRLDILSSGKRADSVVPVLPQEDAAALDAKIRGWVEDLQAQGKGERKLAERAARIDWLIDRAERCEAARLARRVRKAMFR